MNKGNEDVIEIDLQEIAGLLLHWLWLILLCGMLTGVIGFSISKFVITPQYESVTSIYVLNKNDSNNVTYSDVQLGSQLTKDYVTLIKSRTVLEQVINTCELELSYKQLADRVKVSAATDTRVISITVTDEDPAQAKLIADEIRIVASERIMKVTGIEAVNTVDDAALPVNPASPSISKWTMIGGAVGVMVCVLILVIRFLLDDTIKTSEDVERYLGLSTLALIPINEETDPKKKKGKSHSGEHHSHVFDTPTEENTPAPAQKHSEEIAKEIAPSVVMPEASSGETAVQEETVTEAGEEAAEEVEIEEVEIEEVEETEESKSQNTSYERHHSSHGKGKRR